MIRKIISGGNEGVEQAALDMAIKMDIPHGGWIPHGCKNALPQKYHLKEFGSADPRGCRNKNIQSSDGTLFLFRNEDGENLNGIRQLAKDFNKPFHMVDFQKESKFDSALGICRWIVEHDIGKLNVCGETAPRGSKIYHETMDVLESVVYLCHIEYDSPLSVEFPLTGNRLPKTLDEAVDLLVSELPLKDSVVIANMTGSELGSLNTTLGKYIRDTFDLWNENVSLLTSCRKEAQDENLKIENVSMVIIRALWEYLKKTHRLRIVE
jgi:hypothetical protein